MKFQKINITTARIRGLGDEPYYFEHRGFYAWNIMFTDSSTLCFNNLPFIIVGDTEEEGKILCERLKHNFKQANIHDGDDVAVLYKKGGTVIAIARTGQDVWIDVRDKFAIKTFKELDIVITSLKVH